VEIDNYEEWIVEDILGSEWRIKNGKKQVFYLTKWKGFPLGEATFEPISSFNDGAEHFLCDFHRRNPKAPRDDNFN
jgi:hypothetical protein